MMLTPTTSQKNSTGSSPQPPSRMESADYYDDVILQLSPRYRVITCRDVSQWIIQKKEASHAGPWRGVSYHTCRDSLMRACGSLNLLSAASEDQLLDALPASFREYITERPRS
ncbi:hypothetical protein [Nereida ignava]|uniref:hypothetical protein n=1 Tax=Nereida ignava TaxID=282199 RepID=UPI003F6D5EBF